MSIVALHLGLYTALQTPAIQTAVAKRAAKIISKKVDAQVEIGKLYYLFFNKLSVRELLVTYQQGDTLLSVEKMGVTIRTESLLKGKIEAHSVTLSKGQFNLVQESDSSANIHRLFGLNEEEERELNLPKVELARLRLDNFTFRLIDKFGENWPAKSGIISFDDLQLSEIELRAREIKMGGKRVSGEITTLLFKEQSGFTVTQLKSYVDFIAGVGIFTRELSIEEGGSHLYAPKLELKFKGANSFDNFVNDVTFDAVIEYSTLTFNTLSYFAPLFKEKNLALELKGELYGPINNFSSDKLEIRNSRGETTIETSLAISGIGEEEQELYLKANLRECRTSAGELVEILEGISINNLPEQLRQLPSSLLFFADGKVEGKLSSLFAKGKIESAVGNVIAEAVIGERSIDGKAHLEELDLGLFLPNSSLGKATLSTTLSSYKRAEGTLLSIDSLSIEKLEFNNYPYSNIFAVGKYENHTFDGKVIARDPNLNILFQGIINTAPTRGSASYYDFYADILYADLAALNFDKRDSLSAISLQTIANFTQSEEGELEGTINVRGVNYINSSGEHEIGDISIQSTSQKEHYTLFLRSSFANATYRGELFIAPFFESLIEGTLKEKLPALFAKNGKERRVGNSTFSVEFNRSDAISQLLLPGFYIERGSTLYTTLGGDGLSQIELKSGELRYNETFAKELSLSIEGRDSSSNTTIKSDLISFNGIRLDSSRVTIALEENLINLKSEYSNRSAKKNQLDFLSQIKFESDEEGLRTEVEIFPSQLAINGEQWHFTNSKIVNKDSIYHIDNLHLYSGDQTITIDGKITPDPLEPLSVKVENLKVEHLNAIINSPDIHLAGILTGSGIAYNLLQEPQITADFKGRAFHFNHFPLGELDLSAKWDEINEEVVVKLINQLDGSYPLLADGTISTKGGGINLNLKLDHLKAHFLTPILEEVVHTIEGDITGGASLKIKGGEIALLADNLLLNELYATVDFTGVKYNLEGSVSIERDRISFTRVSIKDQYGSTGRAIGALYHNNFDEMTLNTTLLFNNLELLNLSESESDDLFYGNAFGTGRLTIKGPLEKLVMDAAIATDKKTSVHIPLPTAADARDNTLLSFVEPESKGERVVIKESEEEGTIEMKFKIEVTPDAAVMIEIDKSVGDVITSYGSGLVSLEVNPELDLFSVHGDYTIERGFYKFVLQGFIERDFTINEGGTLIFNGDLLKTDLNLSANYRTKAAINTLLADTTAMAARRNVDCQINMSGALTNPRLSFGIEIPDIDPLTKARVDAALNSEDKVVRQVMSLLVSGSFIPDVQSSIVNNSTLLYSNATELLSNQINKIFTQLEIPLDLSFNYLPGQNSGRDMFDAAVSAQLFDNRVIVNGNIGSAKYLERAGEIAGDLDVEIKLDERGRFRAKAFSHSADQYSNYLDNSQRNGIGLVYQEEFSTFKELIRNLFTSKRRAKKREEEALLEKMLQEEIKESL